MGITAPPPRCYLVEWYRSKISEETLDHVAAQLDDGAASLSAEGTPVQLLTVLAVPTDDVIFAVFAASSADLASRVCERAGIPARRLSVAVTARVASADRRETPDDSPVFSP